MFVEISAGVRHRENTVKTRRVVDNASLLHTLHGRLSLPHKGWGSHPRVKGLRRRERQLTVEGPICQEYVIKPGLNLSNMFSVKITL